MSKAWTILLVILAATTRNARQQRTSCAICGLAASHRVLRTLLTADAS